MNRPDKRQIDELRSVEIATGIQKDPAGSVQISQGQTTVLVAANVSSKVPPWLAGQGRGWITAEYAMLPGAVPGRGRRSGGGRAREIQRLIGRSLRAAYDLDALGEHLITVDCDVIQADGGTRVASICAGWVAVALAIKKLQAEGKLDKDPIRQPVVAVSCVKVDGRVVLDPNYDEDHRADVDANFVLTHAGQYVEIQSTAEGAPFADADLTEMLKLAKKGADELAALQRKVIEDQTS